MINGKNKMVHGNRNREHRNRGDPDKKSVRKRKLKNNKKNNKIRKK